MRSKSIELMNEIKKYIEEYYLQYRQSPSTTKIAEAVGIARGTAYKYLVEMSERNMIEYDGQEISTEVTRKYNKEQTQTPIVGSVPCGSPQYEEENIEEYVSLPTAIFGKGDFFILRASGQSMIEAGIDDGDLVVVRKQVEANEGDIVVALVDNQNTLKRYYRDNANKKIILHLNTYEISFYSSLQKLEKSLPDYFIRCHRSYIVNFMFIQKADLINGEFYLNKKTVIPISQKYKAKLAKML